MKKSIFTICCTLFAFSLFAQQPDTLTVENMNLTSVAGVSTIAPVILNGTGIPTFAPATNAVWDLTNLYYGPTFTTTRLNGPAPYNFSDTVFSSFFKVNFHYLSLSNTYLQGFIQYGIETDTQVIHPYANGSRLNVQFPTLSNGLSAAYYLLPLPLVYQDSWTATDGYVFNFNVSDSDLFVYNRPGFLVKSFFDTNRVVGWGKMKVNTTDSVHGSSSSLVKSGYINVLQVEEKLTTIDTVSLRDTGVAYNKILDSIGLPKTYTVVGDTSRVIDTSIAQVDTTLHIDTMLHIDTVAVGQYDSTYTFDSTYAHDTTFAYDTVSTTVVLDSTAHYIHRDTVSTYRQLFYRIGTFTPLVTVVFNDANFDSVLSIRVNTDNLSIFNEGVGNVSAASNIRVYPNPVVNNQVFIDISEAQTGTWSYDLLNISGQVIATNTISSGGGQIHTQISLSHNLAAGVYYLQIKNNGNQVSVKPLEITQ